MAHPLDLLIVGAGPAGISAALWSRTFGLEARVLEAGSRPGGQLHLIHFHPLEVPGIPEGHGPAIAEVCASQLEASGIDVRTESRAVALEPVTQGGWRVRTQNGESHVSRAILIATGLRRRRLGVPGELELEDRGVSFSARRDRDRFAGSDVVVIGGGDGAFENALLLAEVGCRVVILVRDEVRARPAFRDRVARARIEIHRGARVAALLGRDRLEAVRLEAGGHVIERAAQGAVIKIGMDPNTEWCTTLERDPEGYLVTRPHRRASMDGVWVAGDCARPPVPSIASAIGAGADAVAELHASLRGCP